MIKLEKNIKFQSLEEEITFYQEKANEWINLHELNKRENKKLSLKISTDLPSGMIAIDELINFSENLQTIFKNIVKNEALKSGIKLSRAEINQNASLVISDVRAGSFEIDMQQKKVNTLENDLNKDFEELIPKNQQPSLSNLIDLFQEIYEENLYDLAKKYDYNIFKNIKNLIEKSRKKNNSFDIKYDKNTLKFNEKKLSNLAEKFKKFEIDKLEDVVEIKGKIIAVNHESCHLIVKEKETDKNIKIIIKDNDFKNKEILSNQNIDIHVTKVKEVIGNEIIKSEVVLKDLTQLKMNKDK